MSIQHTHFPSLFSTQGHLLQNWQRLSLEDRSVLISTDEQTDGYGRRGSNWKHLGQSLAMSFTIQGHRPNLGLTSLEIGCLVTQFFQIPTLQLKWPNDLIYQNKKCGGLILQSLSDGFFACGLGLNINEKQDQLKELDQGVEASSLPLLEKVENKELAYKLYAFILDNRMSSAEIKETFLSLCAHLNQHCQIKQGREVVAEGEFIGLGEHGEALLKDYRGEIQKHYSGSLRWGANL